MSEPEAAPPPAPGSVDAAIAGPGTDASAAAAPSSSSPPRPLRAFCIDALLALAILFALSLLSGFVWAISHAVTLQLAGRTPDPVRDMQSSGLAILGIAAVSTASIVSRAAGVRNRLGFAITCLARNEVGCVGSRAGAYTSSVSRARVSAT